MKKIPYAAQWIDKEDILAVIKGLKNPYLTQGPAVDNFEEKVAAYCGSKYAVAVNSGTSALHIACLAAGVSRGDEVITSPITFVASANASLYCGAKPVFADVLEDTVTIDPEEIEKKVTQNTKAVIPVDFAGHPAEMAEIRKISDKYGIVLIEDAAHSLGSKYRGEKTGSGKYADMTTLSFHAVKHITTGEGGMVLTNSRRYYEKLKMLRTHGITKDKSFLFQNQGPWYYEMQELGFNYRLTDIQSVLGVSQLKKLGMFLKRRKEIAGQYDEKFSLYKEVAPLTIKPYADSARHIYILKFDTDVLKISRREIFEEYQKNGVGVNVHYIPVYLQPFYGKLGYKKGACPISEKYYSQAVTLPLFPKMSDADVKRVIKVTDEIIKKYGH